MNAATAGGRLRLLADGNRVPVLGLGVWQESVGHALRDSGVPRDQVFVTTKFHPRRNDPVAEAEKSLRRLGVEQIDLYLAHSPEGSATRAWAGLERARELGLTRSIGVADISAAELYAVIEGGSGRLGLTLKLSFRLLIFSSDRSIARKALHALAKRVKLSLV
jgi:hypothetical protein